MSDVTMHEVVLKSWKSMNEYLPDLREDQLRDLINWEMSHKGRKDILIRMHQRFSKLCAERERVEILAKLENSNEQLL